jgi:glucose-6-phosphate 3-dehydrogenase
MRIGIIGAGNVAAAHTRAIGANAAAALAGLYDIAPERAASAASQFACRSFASPEEMYDQVDGVIIASPNHTHASFAKQALGRRKHVLCEKPMTTTVDEARRMTGLAERSGLVCCVGFNYRHLEVVQEIRKMLADGQLGTILFAELGLRRSSALTRTVYTWRDSSIGGLTSGALGDLGVHLIDLIRFLFGSDVRTDTCRIKLQINVPEREGRQVEVDDYAFLSGHLDSGVFFNLAASKASPPEEQGFSLRIIGDRKELSYHSRDGTSYRLRSRVVWEERRLARQGRLADPPGEIIGWGDTFYHQLAAWNAAASLGAASATLAGFSDGLRTQEILNRLLASGRDSDLRLASA